MPLASPFADPRAAPRRPGPRALTEVLTGACAVGLHLQPIIDLASGEVWGVEALARFPGHPAPGPDAWFASALRDGRGVALEVVALRAALGVRHRLPDAVRLTVNLSARALLRPAVRDLLAEAVRPQLMVELTEHEQVGDYPALTDALAVLRALGVGVCIDDFGAGHSSLQHVLHLEPDVVKLDLALVQGVGTCPRRQALVQAMLAFCESTGVTLVAEGVEAADDLAQLKSAGVRHGQGWFLARPADPEVVLSLLAADPAPVLVLP